MSDDRRFYAKQRAEALIESLEVSVQQDAEQEIRGIARSTFAAVIAELQDVVPNDPVAQSVADTYMQEITDGEPIRCVDALLVARQLGAAVGVGVSDYDAF